MTNREIFQRILSLYAKGVHTRDIKLTRRHIYNKALTSRNRLLQREVNKKVSLSLENYQILNCLKLELAPITECNCIPQEILDLTKKVYKSVLPIPEILKANSGYLVKGIHTVDGQMYLDYEQYSNLKYYKGRKWGLTKPFVFIHNNYLYEINADYQLLSIEAIFTNPLRVFEFNNCDCEDYVECDSYLDKDFPLEGTLVEALLDLIKEELIGLFQHGKVDNSNNSQDNSNQQQLQQ